MKNLKLAILDTVGIEFTGDTLERRGLGGSESAIIYISKELSKIGFEITVFNKCEQEGLYDGVQYYNIEKTKENTEFFDILISTRTVLPFVPIEYREEILNNYPFYYDIQTFQPLIEKSFYKVMWLHDTFILGEEWVEELLENNIYQEIFTLSDWHTQYIINAQHGQLPRCFGSIKRKIFQTRNGIKNFFEEVDIAEKDKNLFIYNASSTKGLYNLLKDVWPLVEKEIPEAKLKIIGGYYSLGEIDEVQQLFIDLQEENKDNKSIEFTGIITQEEVAKICKKASYFIYPNIYPETFGISATEAINYNMVLITNRFGALEETAPESVSYLIDRPLTYKMENYTNATPIPDNNQLQDFLNNVFLAYNDDYLRQQKMYAANEFKPFLGWDTVALQWKNHFYKKLKLFMPVSELKEFYYRTSRLNTLYKRRFHNEDDFIEDYSLYNKNDIVVISPVYNAKDFIENNINSVASQLYPHYHHIIIDDLSDDGTYEIAKETIEKLPDDIRSAFTLIKNENKEYALGNQVKILEQIKGDPIIVLLDGDDWLNNDPFIFEFINREYEKGIKFTYGSCYSLADDINLISQPYPKEVHKNKTYRKHKFNWGMPYTHLRTFRKSLFDNMDKSLLLDSQGKYWRAGGDNALFYPLIEQCEEKEIGVIQKILMIYNDINPLNDYKIHGEEQMKNQSLIVDKEEKIRILIGIPTAKYIESDTFKSLYDLAIPENVQVEFDYFYGYRIDQIRNLMSEHAIKRNFDYILFLDSDIVMPKDTLLKLLNTNKEIVSGIYVQRYEDKKIAEIHTKEGHVTSESFFEGKEIVEVDSVGFGCILIKTEVLKKIGYPQFEYHPALRIEDTFSEDADFCKKARELGYSINILTNLHYGHISSTVLKWKE